ncbi:ER membrane protein complex subunit 1-like, partial [Lampetra fluviatilis]
SRRSPPSSSSTRSRVARLPRPDTTNPPSATLTTPLLQTLLLQPLQLQQQQQQQQLQQQQQQLQQQQQQQQQQQAEAAVTVGDPSHTKLLLLLHTDLTVSVSPSTPPLLSQLRACSHSVFFFVANVTAGTVQGYQLQPDLRVSPVWRLFFSPETQTIVSVEGKRPGEHVHSPGRVLGDRSVMYKYLNRNVVAVALQSVEPGTTATTATTTGTTGTTGGGGGAGPPSERGWVSVLVDTVTGSLLHSAVVRRARGPLRMVHSENWLV